jgi:Zn-dependent protease with chaperone function
VENVVVEPGGAPPANVVQVEPWPSELPLTVLVVLASLGVWALLALTIIGLIYVLFIFLFLFFVQLAFVTHLRGSAVKLGPEQFPELHARVVELGRRAGLERLPDAYLMQAGGSLNALATKFFRGRMIVLFSDLLDACGDDRAARDMVIGHELGHLRRGHLDWLLFKAPGALVPFLGAAYSRACEYTCDRWGAALCGDPAGAARGLAVLAAGGAHGPRVNLRAFVAQQEDLDTGWMTIGRWLGGYPPLSARVQAVQPALAAGPVVAIRGPVRAILILAAVFVLPSVAGLAAAVVWMTKVAPLLAAAGSADAPAFADGSTAPIEDEAADEESLALPADQVPAAREKAASDLEALGAAVRESFAAEGVGPADGDALRALWVERRGEQAYPIDPFDGQPYGVSSGDSGELVLFSSGPDGRPFTDDDLRLALAEIAGPDVE